MKNIIYIFLLLAIISCTTTPLITPETYCHGDILKLTNKETLVSDTVVVDGVSEYYLLLNSKGYSYSDLNTIYKIEKLEL